MMRKLPNFSANLFETLMLFLLDVEDDPLWHQVRACVTSHPQWIRSGSACTSPPALRHEYGYGN